MRLPPDFELMKPPAVRQLLQAEQPSLLLPPLQLEGGCPLAGLGVEGGGQGAQGADRPVEEGRGEGGQQPPCPHQHHGHPGRGVSETIGIHPGDFSVTSNLFFLGRTG